MEKLPRYLGTLGVLTFLFAVAGRFKDEPSITLLGERFQSITFVIVANTLILIGIFLATLKNKGGR